MHKLNNNLKLLYLNLLIKKQASTFADHDLNGTSESHCYFFVTFHNIQHPAIRNLFYLFDY